MSKLIWLGAIVLVAFVVGYNALENNEADKNVAQQPNEAPVVEEVIVESNLNVRKKPTPARQRRNIIYIYPVEEYVLTANKRQKRQFPNFGSSQSSANANAFNQQFGPNGFGSSSALAQAQGFHNNGPLGGFGANSAGSQTQSFQAGPDGIRGSAAFSQGQNYDLPNGHHLSLNLANGFSIGPDGKPVRSNANTLTYT